MLGSGVQRHKGRASNMPTHRTGFVFDEHYLLHDTGVQTTVTTRNGSFEVAPEPHPSSLYIIQRIKQFLDGSGLTAQMLPIAARPQRRMR